MERTQLEDRCDAKDSGDLNAELVRTVLLNAYNAGVEEFCICPGARNSPFVMTLEKSENIFYWPEERSAAFFALGKSRAADRPVAVITTSGTAVGELLPAAMEAAYSGVPLLLITADRPRRYRGTGAPQTAEQVGIFGTYVTHSQDLADYDLCDLSEWDQKGPAHINVCFEEPLIKTICKERFTPAKKTLPATLANSLPLDQFFQRVERPLALVSTLLPRDRAAVLEFLLALNAPVYLEAISGLREEPKLQHLRLHNVEKRVKEFDSVLRLGGVPTTRLWRDLEDHRLEVLSITHSPFSGLSHGKLLQTDLAPFLASYQVKRRYDFAVQTEHPQDHCSERAMIHDLSKLIPEGSLVYLGNSLPIRHWDLAASLKRFEVFASRGLNGIDGQISTFLGLCGATQENWALIGDLTALYDLAAPWVIPQLAAQKIAIVVVNNGGGQIFNKMFPSKLFLNEHNLSFESMAKFWGLHYERWSAIPEQFSLLRPTLIELT